MLMTPTEIRDAIIMALGALRANKFRAFLTILGVMVGVSSVIGLASIIGGLNGQMANEIDQLGSNVIMVTKNDMMMDHDELTESQRNRKPITVGEAEAILATCSTIDGVSPQNYYFQPGGNEVKFSNRKANQPSVMGTWPDFIKVNNRSVAQGRFFSETDQQYRSMVCVIDGKTSEALFEGEHPIDREIRINGNLFRVVGVMQDVKAKFIDDNERPTVMIPLSTFQKLYPWEKELFLQAKARTQAEIDKAQEEIINTLRIYRKVPFGEDNDFALSTQEQFKSFINNITKYLYLAMIVITSVGLMVGGIGVANIMLVSVTERTREIGIRKAIGARRVNIIFQFLTEAMTLSGTGGVIGIIIGIALGSIVNAIAGFPLVISIVWIIIGFGVSVSVGLISGIYPAIKASRQDPIEALRYE
ncbi:MAG: ABC transporter permease [candidate division Zixibacteria bacterium]|nr:ABC transporter permease [candidate division Zixibacteria bacterium]